MKIYVLYKILRNWLYIIAGVSIAVATISCSDAANAAKTAGGANGVVSGGAGDVVSNIGSVAPPPSGATGTPGGSNIGDWAVDIRDSAPVRKLGLFFARENGSQSRCLQKNSAAADTTQETCDLFRKAQWFYKDTDSSIKHFATGTTCTTCTGRFVSLALRVDDSFYTLDGGERVSFDQVGPDTSQSSGGQQQSMAVLFRSSAHQTQMRLVTSRANQGVEIQGLTVTGANGQVICSQSSANAINIPDRTNRTFLVANASCSGSSTQIQISVSISQVSRIQSADDGTALAFTLSDTDNTVASASGYYTATTGEYFLDFILAQPQVRTIRFVHLPGSSDDASLAYYARYIRAAGWTTYLPATGRAFSGGVDLFLAGSDRVVEEGGVLGVHSWSGDGIVGGALPESHSAHAPLISYTTTMLGDIGREFYFFTLEGDRVAGENGIGICKMTTGQIRRYITTTIQDTPSGVTTTAFTSLTSEPACQDFTQQ